MELKTEKIETITVDDNDLNVFINHHYPNLQGKFRVIADEDLGNDSYILIRVTGEVDKYGKDAIKNGVISYMSYTYLNDLCRKGAIPAGKYLIRIT